MSAFATGGLGFVFLTGLWQPLMQSLYLTALAVSLCLVIGGALGVWAASNDRVSYVLRPINDALQTMPVPRHGGDNWVRLTLPEPLGWITAYRSKGRVGAFARLKGPDGEALFQRLASDLPSLRAETGLQLTLKGERSEPFEGTLAADDAVPAEDDQLEWLKNAANRLVTQLRLRLDQARLAELVS